MPPFHELGIVAGAGGARPAGTALDPTGFMLRRYLPRVTSAYEGLDQIPVSAGTVYLGLVHSAIHYARPEVLRAFECLAAAGHVVEDWLGHMLPFVGEMAAAGFLPEDGTANGLSFAAGRSCARAD